MGRTRAIQQIEFGALTVGVVTGSDRTQLERLSHQSNQLGGVGIEHDGPA